MYWCKQSKAKECLKQNAAQRSFIDTYIKQNVMLFSLNKLRENRMNVLLCWTFRTLLPFQGPSLYARIETMHLCVFCFLARKKMLTLFPAQSWNTFWNLAFTFDWKACFLYDSKSKCSNLFGDCVNVWCFADFGNVIQIKASWYSYYMISFRVFHRYSVNLLERTLQSKSVDISCIVEWSHWWI